MVGVASIDLAGLLPFTDWQNDLHLIIDTAQRHFLYLRSDLAKLITAATRAFSGAHSIGSCEDRSYLCHFEFQKTGLSGQI